MSRRARCGTLDVSRRSDRRTAEQRPSMSINVNAARSEALFASPLQLSQQPTAQQLREAIMQTVRSLGTRGCAARVAQEFGDHPDLAVRRMCWARQQVARMLIADRLQVTRLRPRTAAMATQSAA